ncbi:MAG TPA: SDR family NAD(P)-dependent oxidoreductase, partial [Halioglobus sp.]
MAEKNRQQARNLLITGATGGMGRAATLLAAGEGYNLVLADLSQEKLEELVAEISRHGVMTRCQTLDVTQSASIDELISVVAANGGVDAIIHTVGLSPQMAASKRIIDVDLIGTVELLEKARPVLQAGGCALCIASMSAYMVPANEDVEYALAESLAGTHAQLDAMYC